MFRSTVKIASPQTNSPDSSTLESLLRPFLDRPTSSFYYLLNQSKRPQSTSPSKPNHSPQKTSSTFQYSCFHSSPIKSDLMSTAGTKFINKARKSESLSQEKRSVKDLAEENQMFVNLYNAEVKRHQVAKQGWIEYIERLENEIGERKQGDVKKLVKENRRLRKELEEYKTDSDQTIKALWSQVSALKVPSVNNIS